MRSRVLLGLIFGTLGGFLGYLIQEPLIPHGDLNLMNPVHQAQINMKLGMILGAMIGLGIGAVEGAVLQSPRVLLKGLLLGTGIGAIGGIFGLYFGGAVYNLALFGKSPELLQGSHNILDFTHLVIARALGWTLLGALPGLAAGAATLSHKRAIHGLLGGIIGGFIGGALFDIVGEIVAPVLGPAAAAGSTVRYDAGGPSRAIGFTIIGALTGLFIGLVQELLKQAWVRVLAGKNEGKDYIISKPMSILGRDERADVPLFGDQMLAPQHAAIKQENGRHWLYDGGTQGGSVVNGQRVDEKMLLKDGDMVQLGQVRILFREKATATRAGRQAPDMPRSAQAPGNLSMPAHLCPFCGAAKDAQGGCMCTVAGGGAPPPMPMSPMSASPMPMTGYSDPGVSSGGFGAAPAFGSDPGVFGAPSSFGAPATMAPTMGGMGGGNRLLAMDGPYAGQSFPLASPNVGVGRDPAREVALTNDTTISRRHAHIAMENGQHVVYDDGSSNGTFVNNVRISVQALAPGDVVQFGSSRFRYE